MHRRFVVAALGLATCAAEAPLEPAEFAELCGVAGPVELISLEPDQQLTDDLIVFEGRHVYAASRIDANRWAFLDSFAASVGPCGEAPRRIAEGVRFIHTDERWPGVLFGCHMSTGDLVVLDPTGERPPHVAFADVGCAIPRPDASAIVRLVGEEGGLAALVVHPIPEDPRTETSEGRVLLDEVSTPEYPLTRESRLYVVEDLAFVLTTDGTLLRIDTTDDSVAVEQAGVRKFEVSRDGRYLLYQDIGLTHPDPARTEGIVVLRDRTTGAGLTLAATDLDYGGSALWRVGSGIVELRLPNGVERVYFLPALDFLDLPRYLSLRWSPGDDRYVLQRGSDGPLYVTDLREPGSTTPIFGDGWLLVVEPEGALVLDVPRYGPDSTGREEGGLWLAPFDGRPISRLADRASRDSRLLEKRRLLTKLDIDEAGLADLVVVDLDTQEERLIDRRVASNSGPVWRWFTSAILDGDVVYTVIDEGRVSVRRARLAPR